MKTKSLICCAALILASHDPGLAQELKRGGMSWDVLAQRADANRDGRIIREEFKGPAPLFGRFDRNGDGVLTKEDFDGAKTSGQPQPEAK